MVQQEIVTSDGTTMQHCRPSACMSLQEKGSQADAFLASSGRNNLLCSIEKTLGQKPKAKKGSGIHEESLRCTSVYVCLYATHAMYARYILQYAQYVQCVQYVKYVQNIQ